MWVAHDFMHKKNLKVNELGEMEGRAEMIFKLNE